MSSIHFCKNVAITVVSVASRRVSLQKSAFISANCKHLSFISSIKSSRCAFSQKWLSLSHSLSLQTSLWETVKAQRPCRTRPPTPPRTLSSTTGVATLAPRVGGWRSRSSATLATTATLATASRSRGPSPTYGRTGQSTLVFPAGDFLHGTVSTLSLFLSLPLSPDAGTCRTRQTFPSSASSSSSSTRPYRCCCAPSTRPSRGLRRTCSRKSSWWTTTVTVVRAFLLIFCWISRLVLVLVGN